jgi:hypothetical protein
MRQTEQVSPIFNVKKRNNESQNKGEGQIKKYKYMIEITRNTTAK